jgi:hypothetical protein
MTVDIESDKRKQNFLDVLSKKRGIVLLACQETHTQRSTYYKWVKEDPFFKEAVDIIKEEKDGRNQSYHRRKDSLQNSS